MGETETVVLQFSKTTIDYLQQVLALRPWGEVNALLVDIVSQLEHQPTPRRGPLTEVDDPRRAVND